MKTKWDRGNEFDFTLTVGATTHIVTMTPQIEGTMRPHPSLTATRFRLAIPRFSLACTLGVLYATLFFLATIPHATSLLQNECENRPEPAVQLHDEVLVVNEQNFRKYSAIYPPSSQEDQYAASGPDYFILNKEKSVLYVSNFLNETAAKELKDICISSQRFTRSPIRGHGDDPSVSESDIRTSESCTLVPASIYLANPKYQDMIKQKPIQPHIAKIAREIDLSWDIAVRASTLINVDPNRVEALQLVRYTSPRSEYRLHHDHGGFYGKRTEHRPWTMLIFLNDVSDGGTTAFPELGLEIIPRGGDAVVWSNTNEDGEVDPDMVHLGKPPGVEGIEKYAVNVWFGGESFSTRSKEWGQW